MTKIYMDKDHINLMDDNMFKTLFSSVEARGIITNLINCITGIPKEELEKANFNSVELNKNNIKEKKKISDIIIRIDDNKRIILEMNKDYYNGLFEKNTSYAYNLINITTSINNKRVYPRVILINIDNFNHYNTDKVLLHFMTLEKSEGYKENDLYNSYHLVIENAIKTNYNEDEIKKFSMFLSMNNIKEMLTTFKGDNEYMAGIVKVEDLLKDVDKYGLLYEPEDVSELVLEYKIEQAEKVAMEKGMQEGIKKGIEQTKKESTIELYKNGVSKELIIKSLHITKKELDNYLKEI